MCVLNPTIWAAHPILHMWIFSPLGPSCRGTPNNSDFINLRNSSLWEFRNQAIKKKCWKGAPFSKGNLSWNIWMKGTLAFCDSEGPLPPIGSSCRGTQIILISSIYGMHRYRILQPNYEKKCWKLPFSRWCPFSKVSFRWSTRVKGHPAGAPSARVPAGLPTLSP